MRKIWLGGFILALGIIYCILFAGCFGATKDIPYNSAAYWNTHGYVALIFWGAFLVVDDITKNDK